MQCRRAFTLTELLVVIGIMVLLLTATVPVLRSLTGSSSSQAAENRMAAYLGRVREDGLRTQSRRGVLFFEDPASRRVAIAAVHFADPDSAPRDLELFADRAGGGSLGDVQVLPTGVGMRAIRTAGGYELPGLAMFDGQGRLVLVDFRIRPGSQLAKTAGFDQELTGTSHLGVVTFDADAFSELPAAAQEQWLDQNARALMIHRFKGTLNGGG